MTLIYSWLLRNACQYGMIDAIELRNMLQIGMIDAIEASIKYTPYGAYLGVVGKIF
jgi:hypothetical protein